MKGQMLVALSGYSREPPDSGGPPGGTYHECHRFVFVALFY